MTPRGDRRAGPGPRLGSWATVAGLLIGALSAPGAAALSAEDAGRITALMAGAPPPDQGVVFTVRLVGAAAGEEAHAALAESTGRVVFLTLQDPPRLDGHRVLVRYNLMTHAPTTGRVQTVSGTVRRFDHLPLAQHTALLLLDLAATHAATRLPDVQVDGRTRQVLALEERNEGHPFERIEVRIDPVSGLPVEAHAKSLEDGVEWRVRYRFENRLETPAGPVPHLSSVEVVRLPSGERSVLEVERTRLIDRGKVRRVLH